VEILFLKSVNSTNRYAKEHIEDFADNTVIVTSNQTEGKGRLNRNWSDVGSENIYATIVLKPNSLYKDVYSNLTQYLALVIAKTMEENYNVKPSIKWPNDIKINDKKIAGILAEGVIEKSFVKGLILGFGINLNCTKEILSNIDQPATSLNVETGMHIDKNIFLKKLSDNFCLGYDSFIEKGFSSIADEYKKRCSFLNKSVTVRVYDKEISGIAKNLTDNGALKIVDDNNEEQILYVGDIL